MPGIWPGSGLCDNSAQPAGLARTLLGDSGSKVLGRAFGTLQASSVGSGIAFMDLHILGHRGVFSGTS